MFRPALFIILSLLAVLVSAEEPFHPQFSPTLQVTRATSQFKIDGNLDEPGWATAAVAGHFAENNPGDQVKPPVESKVLICYDEARLYVAFVAWDDPATVRVNLRDRDNIFTDDYFGMMLDTYGDASWGYELFVNPLGIQGDLRMQSNGNEDESFDIVWESVGKVTDSGYQVEAAIPFASLRFPNRTEQVWKVNFWRDRQRDIRRKFSWAAVNRDEPCFMCQWGTITGISGIRSSTNLELLPNVIGLQNGELRDSDNPKSGFKNENPDAQLSLNARYGLSSTSSAEVAINPDFSQVEADATQIDVNSPYALFFSERRPFFQEGSDLYNSWIQAIYTRTIADPEVAAKLTGRFGRTSFAYLVGRDEHSALMIPLSERTEIYQAAKSTSNILRIKQTFMKDSFVGALLTDRRLDGGGAGSVGGFETSIRFLKKYRLRMQHLASHTSEANDTALTSGAGDERFDKGRHTLAYDGESFSGYASFISLVRDARVWNANIEMSQFSPTFRADNGFITRNNTRTVEIWSGLQFRPNGKFLINWQPSIDVGRVWNIDGTRRDEWIIPNVNFTLPLQTEGWIDYVWSRELYRGVWFDGIRKLETGASSRLSSQFSVNFSLQVSHSIARSSQLTTPVLGHENDFGVWFGLKPSKRLVLEPEINYSKMTFPDNGKNIFEYTVGRARVTYQFTREWFLRVVVEYVDGRSYDQGDDSYGYDNSLYIEPLLSYKLNPFTIFYIGSSHGFWDPTSRNSFTYASQKLFAKLQYLFRV